MSNTSFGLSGDLFEVPPAGHRSVLLLEDCPAVTVDCVLVAVFDEQPVLFALLAGLIAYLAGRSRRSAFIAGTMGIVLTDIIARLEVALTGGRTTTVIGGAGIFDTVVLSGIIAVGLAEIIGEGREFLQGGSVKEGAGEKEGEGANLRGVPGPALMETAEEPVPEITIGTETKGNTGEVSRGEKQE